MMQPDPRVFFASERTLLAWVRTGIAIVGLGFVVSRFGLFLRVLYLDTEAGAAVASGHGYANLLGIALVLLGTASIIIACIQHGRFIATLPPSDSPARYSRTWSLWLGALVTIAGLLLATYLTFTT